MNYEMPIRFFDAQGGRVFSLIGEINESVYENRAKIIDKRLYDIPTVNEGATAKLSNELSAKDRSWITELFTVKFIYWAKKGILGVAGAAAEIENFSVPSSAVIFQNGYDRDYACESYPKLPFFQVMIQRNRELSVEDIRRIANRTADESEDYVNIVVRDTYLYDCIESELEIPAIIAGTEGESFETISINALNSFDKVKTVEKMVYDYIYREQLRRELK